MVKTSLFRLSLGLLVVFLTACSGVSITVTSPDPNTIYTEVPEFAVSWEGADTSEGFVAKLNGRDITDRFVIEGNTATLSDQTLMSDLRHNKNLFTVNLGTSFASKVNRNFTVDLKGPQVQIVTTTEEVGVSTTAVGTVWDPSGVASMSFQVSNGTTGPVTINEDGTFTVEMPYSDSNEIVFTATDNIGQVSTTTFNRSAEDTIGETLNFRANVQALTVISEVAPDLIAAVDLPSYLVSDKALVEVPILLDKVRVYIDDAAMSVPDVNVAPSSTEGMDVDMDLTIADLDMQMRICYDSILLPEICQEAFVDSTSLFADVTADLGADSDGMITVNDMIIDFNVEGLDIGLNLFNMSALGISIPDILQPITDSLINIFGNVFVDLLRPVLDNILTLVLGEVPIAFNLSLHYDGEATARNLNVGTYFNDIYREGDALVMTMGLNNDVFPYEGINDPLGVRTFGFHAPESLVTPSNRESDFVLGMSASFLNHMLHDLYVAGMINVDVPLGTVNGKPAFARLSPKEPPFMSIEEFDLGMAELHVWNFDVVVEIQKDATDASLGFDTFFNASLNMDVPLDITAPGDGTLGIELSNQLSIEVNDLVMVIDLGVGENFINSILTEAAGPMMIGLSDAMSQIQLPSILGMNIIPVEIWADKANGTFVIAGDMEMAPEIPAELQ